MTRTFRFRSKGLGSTWTIGLDQPVGTISFGSFRPTRFHLRERTFVVHQRFWTGQRILRDEFDADLATCDSIFALGPYSYSFRLGETDYRLKAIGGFLNRRMQLVRLDAPDEDGNAPAEIPQFECRWTGTWTPVMSLHEYEGGDDLPDEFLVFVALLIIERRTAGAVVAATAGI